MMLTIQNVLAASVDAVAPAFTLTCSKIDALKAAWL
jgi:hypothetical protein